jgi:hypothetical protein
MKTLPVKDVSWKVRLASSAVRVSVKERSPVVLVRLRLVPSDPEKVVVQRTAAPAGEARARIERVRSEAEVAGLIMIRALVFAEDAIDVSKWSRVVGY